VVQCLNFKCTKLLFSFCFRVVFLSPRITTLNLLFNVPKPNGEISLKTNNAPFAHASPASFFYEDISPRYKDTCAPRTGGLLLFSLSLPSFCFRLPCDSNANNVSTLHVYRLPFRAPILFSTVVLTKSVISISCRCNLEACSRRLTQSSVGSCNTV
jgi:hypothetical protein